MDGSYPLKNVAASIIFHQQKAATNFNILPSPRETSFRIAHSHGKTHVCISGSRPFPQRPAPSNLANGEPRLGATIIIRLSYNVGHPGKLSF